MITPTQPRPDDLTDLRILDELNRDPSLSQREISRRVGVSVGLTNLILRRMAKKTWIKMRTMPGKRMLYALTPRGITEKVRKTRDFLSLSLRYYGDLRQTLVQRIRETGIKSPRVAAFGAGDLLPLVIEASKEAGARFVGPVDGERNSVKKNIIILVSKPPRNQRETWSRAGIELIEIS